MLEKSLAGTSLLTIPKPGPQPGPTKYFLNITVVPAEEGGDGSLVLTTTDDSETIELTHGVDYVIVRLELTEEQLENTYTLSSFGYTGATFKDVWGNDMQDDIMSYEFSYENQTFPVIFPTIIPEGTEPGEGYTTDIVGGRRRQNP